MGVPEISVSANIISALVYFDIALNCTLTQSLFSLTFYVSPISAQSRTAHGVSQEMHSHLPHLLLKSSVSVPFPAMKHLLVSGFSASTLQIPAQPGISKSPEQEPSCSDASDAAGLFVTKLFVQPFLVTYMDSDLFCEVVDSRGPISLSGSCCPFQCSDSLLTPLWVVFFFLSFQT